MGFWNSLINPEPDPLAAYSDDELQTAALRVLKERPSCSKSWIGGTVKQCDDALEHIKWLRLQYENYEPRRMRKAVMDWLAFYEREALENRRDCETQKSRRDKDEYRKKNDAREKVTRSILDTLKK